MSEIVNQIEQAGRAIRDTCALRPRVAIILGTGLGEFVEQINVAGEIDYADIPYFATTTAVGHRGRLLLGSASGVPIVTMDGRFHRYEGHSLQQIALPVRVMRELGAELLVVSNASGGVRPGLQCGEIVLIEDHINLMWDNPLRGPNEESLGPRFPDMSAPYELRLIRCAERIGRTAGFATQRGVYAAMTGPNYETPAEIRALRALGGHVVGMSAAPEVCRCRELGLPVAVVACVTNNCCTPERLTHKDVLETAGKASNRLVALLRGFLETP